MGQSPDGSTYSDEPSDYILVQGNADLQNGWVCPRIWTTQITKKADAGDLIMSVRAPAGAMGKTAYNAVIGRGVAAIKGNEFIYQLLVKMDADGFWKTLSCGSTFESLNSDNIKIAEVKIPTTAEQIKIGGYFQQLDNLITLHQRQSFSHSTPDISLSVQLIHPFYTSSWEQRKLGDIASDMVAGGDIDKDLILAEGQYPVIANALTGDGIVGYYDNDYRVNAPAVTVTGRGDVGHAKARLVNFTPVVRLLSVKSEHDVFFLENAINTLKIVIESTGVPQLTVPQLAKYEVAFPRQLDEEEHIGAFFKQLDHLITLHQRKCANLCSPSQVVFSLLFATSTFSWEQRKFGEITSKYEDPVPTPHDGYYRLGIRSHAKGTFHSYVAKGQELETAQMHRVAAGNFIVNITFGWEHAVAITDKNDAGKLVSHRFPQFSFAEGMVPEFFRYVIVDEKFRHHLWLASPGGAGRNRVLKLDEMLNYLMRFPSRDEQIKIAEFFRHLDNLITLHQRELEKLQNIKKSMLEKMFV